MSLLICAASLLFLAAFMLHVALEMIETSDTLEDYATFDASEPTVDEQAARWTRLAATLTERAMYLDCEAAEQRVLDIAARAIGKADIILGLA